MDYGSDSSEGWINASSDSESSNSVTLNMGLSDQEQEENLVNDSEGKKHKKAKKRKHDDDSSVSDDRPAKKKHIKTEPESDRDKSGADESIVHSESFDNLRIKQESADNSDEPRKKKKKHKKSEEESNNESTLLNGTQDVLEVTSVEDSVRKKKKKKKSKCSESEDVGDEPINLQELQNGRQGDIVDVKSKRKYLLSSTVLENNLNETNETINISAIPSTVPKTTKRISDRLKFEDDEIVSTLENAYDSDKEVTFSREVKTFLKGNPNISPFTSFVPFKTDEEDIFIVKCPSEIDVKDFKDINLVLDGKSKLKVAGQTYDGIVTKTDTKIPLVTYSKKNVYHKNLPVLKTIVFHKRIPVLHIQDDSVVMSNQTRFIPLPDTKCRHPLFGTDYKKAIKVPKVVRERLSENDLQPEKVEQETLYKNKKKKHKKEKETVERECEVDSTVNVKEEGESSKKKKKKRKIKEETEAKPAKRVKLEQNPEAWESEKAIEENLFNF